MHPSTIRENRWHRMCTASHSSWGRIFFAAKEFFAGSLLVSHGGTVTKWSGHALVICDSCVCRLICFFYPSIPQSLLIYQFIDQSIWYLRSTFVRLSLHLSIFLILSNNMFVFTGDRPLYVSSHQSIYYWSHYLGIYLPLLTCLSSQSTYHWSIKFVNPSLRQRRRVFRMVNQPLTLRWLLLVVTSSIVRVYY